MVLFRWLTDSFFIASFPGLCIAFIQLETGAKHNNYGNQREHTINGNTEN